MAVSVQLSRAAVAPRPYTRAARLPVRAAVAALGVRRQPQSRGGALVVRAAADRGWDRAWDLPPAAGAGSRSQQQQAAAGSKAAAFGNPVKQYDFLVIGSGIAGLSYALKVAEYGRVAIVTKDQASEGCTRYAQGGVCAVLDKTDSVADHVRDTIVAGAFLNDAQAVEVVCREGPPRVLELVEMGAEFTRNRDGSLHLTKEGGHSNRRIVHAADLTGAEIERALLEQARGHRNVTFYEHHLAIDLVVDDHLGMPHCFGADVLDQRSNQMCRFLGLSTMLASGGAGQVYPNTTNPRVATGDGIAMAYRARANISNMEFVQFHPTGLYNPETTPGVSNFLITEAVRGEGGLLFNQRGERFMERYDAERLELAPRDVVARAIHDQLLQHGSEHVWLDISHKDKHEVLHHFPNIAAKCGELGIDITSAPIPVVPVQHYTCGGVSTGLLGETNVQGLYACGEVACSGLHGANRLASNSLLEGLVFGERAVNPSVAHAEHALRSCGRQLHYAAASADFRGASAARPLTPDLAQWVATRRQELRDVMWRHVGIVRRTRELLKARDAIVMVLLEAKAIRKNYGVNTELVELLNLATVAELTVSCALQRKESRGLHYTADYPQPVESQRRPSVITTSLKTRYANVAPLQGSLSEVSYVDLLPLQSNVSVLPSPSQDKANGVATRRGVRRPRDLAVRSTPQDL